jgi:hypothetical protein
LSQADFDIMRFGFLNKMAQKRRFHTCFRVKVLGEIDDLQKTPFSELPYVCPEPVLVN